jgi:hypothetical protein
MAIETILVAIKGNRKKKGKKQDGGIERGRKDMDRFWLPLDYSNRNYNFFVI